jgi:uncharacterized protein (TIGR03000 family)
MLRSRILAIIIVSAIVPALVPAGQAQAEKPAGQKPSGVKSVVTVTVPERDAELKVQGKVTKTQGDKREFDTPPLEAGKFFTYTFELKYMPNNYTTITRTRSVNFKAGDPVTVDFTKEDPDDKAVIRYVPTPDDIVKKMLEFGKVGKDDIVYDLGCGDARMVIAAVKVANAKKGVGIDIDPERIAESKANVAKEKVEQKVEIVQGDLLDEKVLARVAEATVILIYMSDEFDALLKPKLLKVLKPGTRIVSHRFKMGDWKPDESITVMGEDGDQYTLHRWTVKKDK